jgi:hypothetical protein
MTLVAFRAQFLEAPFWKGTTILLSKKKHKKCYLF